MSNDSREAFEKSWTSAGWVLGPFDNESGNYEYQSTEWGWIGWQAAQSRHAEEREALVRKCAEICDRHTRMSWNCDRRAQAKLLRDEILALLSDSGSQG